MNVTDTCCKHIYTKISYTLALVRICALAHADNAVFLAADGTNLSLDGHSHCMCNLNQLLGLLNVLVDRIVGTVEHDGCESSLDALVASFVCTMIQMKCNRNCDTELIMHCLYHRCNCTETGHILTSALGNTKDYRRL